MSAQSVPARFSAAPGTLHRAAAPLALMSPVMQASFHEQPAPPGETVPPPPAKPELPAWMTTMPVDGFPIDLATTLQLAGANNLQVALARARIAEAQAQFALARASWLPSLQAGAGYNRHDGQIQDTTGQVLEVSRSSVFAGGGAASAGFPLAGGANGPARLAVSVSLSDALFAPLAARQSVRARQADGRTAFNDGQLAAAATYLALTEAYAQLMIAQGAMQYAEELVRITKDFDEVGRGLQADVNRSRAELTRYQEALYRAEERVGVVSAELVRQLRLDPTVTLFPLEAPVGQLDLIDINCPLGGLISIALRTRPELVRERAVLQETYERTRQEYWRPWLPNLYAGVSGGGFGGGSGSFIGNFSDRFDFDALAVWEVRNLGLGTQALRAGAQSRNTHAQFSLAATRDQVAAQVASAFRETSARRKQISAAEKRLAAASAALPLNFEGIRGGALRPIEAQQAIVALAEAQTAFIAALVGYNQAQFGLLRAIGDFPVVDAGDGPPEPLSVDAATAAPVPSQPD